MKLKNLYLFNFMKYLLTFCIGAVAYSTWTELNLMSSKKKIFDGKNLSKIENRLRADVEKLVSKYGLDVQLIRKQDLLVIRILDRDVFPINSWSPLRAGERFITDLAEALKKYDVEFEVSGHYDSINPYAKGKKEFNQLLISSYRASQIAAYLNHAGVDPKKVSVKGYGSQVLLYVDRDKSGRYLAQEGNLNRRVEISLKHRGSL